MSGLRLRQSMAKVLLQDCPALLKLQLDGQHRKSTKAMNAGSLLDYLVFDQSDRYDVVDARYKSGPREGQPCTDWTGKEAREARVAIESSGVLAVLQTEIDELQPTADAIKSRIFDLAEEMAGPYRFTIVTQPHIEWTSALGTACEGTPDVIVLVHMQDLVKVCTIDVKHTAVLPQKRFEAQISSMYWDMQGAAYREAAVMWAESEYGPAFHLDHIMLCTSSIAVGLPPVARRLSPAYMTGGKRRWERGQRIWQRCLETNEWPGYSEADAEPSHFYIHTEVEAYDESQFTNPITSEDIEP